MQRIATSSNHIAKEDINEVQVPLTILKQCHVIVLLQEERQDYGVDWGGPVLHDSSDHDISIPEIPNPLTRVDMLELQLSYSNFIKD